MKKKAMSPLISEFDGMKISVNYDEPQHRGRAHIHVKADGAVRVFDIHDLELLAGSPLPPPKMRKLKDWMGSSFPEQTKSGTWADTDVGKQLLMDWMSVVNGRMPEKPATPQPIRNLIPTPREIANFKLPPKVGKLKKWDFWDRAKIVKAKVVKNKPFHVYAEFEDGSKKLIDVKAMYEVPNMHPVHPIYTRHIASQEFFNTMQHDAWQVWWGEGGEESEIGHDDLYSAGESA